MFRIIMTNFKVTPEGVAIDLQNPRWYVKKDSISKPATCPLCEAGIPVKEEYHVFTRIQASRRTAAASGTA